MKLLLISLIVLVFMGTGCILDAPGPVSTGFLDGHDHESISEEIATRLTVRYSNDYSISKIEIDDNVSFDGELTLIDSYEVPVINIPEGMQISGYPEPETPIEFYIFIFESEKEELFHSYIYTNDGYNYKIGNFSLAIDSRTGHDPVVSSIWPVEEIKDTAAANKGHMIMIPYPFAIDQLYYQYGKNVKTSQLVNVDTGISYNGIQDLLNKVKVDPDKL